MPFDDQKSKKMVKEAEKCSICSAVLGDQICLHSEHLRFDRAESTPATSNGEIPPVLERPNTQPDLVSRTDHTCEAHFMICPLYCRQCSCFVCMKCIVYDHNTHEMDLAQNIQEIQQQAIIRNKLIDSCRKARINLEKQATRIRDDIKMRVSLIRELLCEKELSLLKKVDDCFKVQDQTLAQYMKTLTQGSLFNCTSSSFDKNIYKSSKLNMVYYIQDIDQITVGNLVGHLLQAIPCIHRASTNLFMEEAFRDLKSLATDDSMIYVAGIYPQPRISIFEEKSLKEAGRGITFPVKSIYDMEVVGKTIFLTDLSTPQLYVLEPSEQLKTIKIDCARATLSTTVAGNVLVTQISKLTHYFPSGTKLKEESLPWKLIEHAIEIKQDEYVITEWNHGVLKIRGKEIIKQYRPDNEHGQTEPCYLATDAFHRIFVSLYKAKQIVLLDSDLERIISIDVNGWPWGICVNKAMSHLYVIFRNQKNRNSIEVYDLDF